MTISSPWSRISFSAVSILGAGLVGCTDLEESVNPAPQGEARPESSVELVTDGLGITHVYAKSDADAFFGAGYAMARDRLFQMELGRRRAMGTTAEVFGAGGLKDDIGARAFGFARLGEADAELQRQERPDDAKLIDAWAAGVNLRIAEVRRGDAPRPYGLRGAELDFVPEPWTAGHAFAVAKVLAFGLSNTLDPEILASALYRLAPDAVAHLPILKPAYDTYILGDGAPTSPPAPAPPAPQARRFGPPSAFPRSGEAAWEYRPIMPWLGSNNWAVSGPLSTNGRPLLAGDPHQGLTSPTRLWPVHMSSVEGGGSFDVIGFAFVGTPAVQLGHNARIGWTATTNFADVMDLWDVTLDADFKSVSLGGQARLVERRDETIRVRVDGAPFGENEDVVQELLTVPGFGIILPDELLPVPRALLADGRILFNWTGFEPSNESTAYLDLDRATDLDGFERAADELEVGAVNLVGADAAGIVYRVRALVPDRGDPSSHPMPTRILPADDAESLWTRGFLPVEKLPALRDPARGFLSTANNDPFGFTADGDVGNDPFYYGSYYAEGSRAHRVDQELTRLTEGGAQVSRADMETLQRDVRSPMADTVLPVLAGAFNSIGTDPALAQYAGRADLTALAARLAAWDRRASVDQAEPVIFLGLAWFAASRAFRESLNPALFDAVASQSPPFLLGLLRNLITGRIPDAAYFAPDGVHALLLGALDDTAAWLVDRYGSTDAAPRLGVIQAAEFPSTFGGDLVVPLEPIGGGADTVNVAPAAFLEAGEPREKLVTRLMALYRMVVGFGEDGTPEATVDFARGAREDPESPYFADQQSTWAAAEHVPLPFRRADVEAAATERATIRGRK